MVHTRSRTRVFTLVELMIVVAIVAVLASIGIPLMVDHQNRAKRAEGEVNVSGLSEAVVAYMPEGREDLVEGLWPRDWSDLDKEPVGWNPNALGKPPPVAWSTLGWSPDGDVRCAYLFEAHPVGMGGSTGGLSAVYCNVDGVSPLWETRLSRGDTTTRVATCTDPGAGGPVCFYDTTPGCECF